MRKRLLTFLTVGALALSMVGCGSTDGDTKKETKGQETSSEKSGSYKVGITIQSLENNYWAGVFGEVEKLLKDKAWEYTIVDCKDNSATQISQIENFITSGCDMIMIHPSDPNAIEDVCKQARDAGIKVMCWDDKMTNTDVNWVLDNTELGKTIGQEAGKFIKEHYTEDKKAQVAIMEYPQTPILKERGEGILAGLEEVAGGSYEVIAKQPALLANDAQSNMETILQANPECKVVCVVSAGGDIGVNQAFMVSTDRQVPEDMGIFSPDATEQQLQAIMNKEASNTSVGFEGSNKKTAAACVDMYEKLLTGATFDDQNVYRPITVINKDNAEEYLADYK